MSAANPVNPAPASARDRGSVTPLLIGLTLCLLLLVAGVTAAGSAFLGRSRLQHACDGAALAAGDAAGPTADPGSAADAAARYLARRPFPVGVRVTLTADTATARCWTSTPVTFGALFLIPTLDQAVTASARLRYLTR